MAEFERLASYAELWGVANEQTYFYMALSSMRLGIEKSPNKQYMEKLTDINKRKQLEEHINKSIKDLNWQNRHQFRELMDTSSEIYFSTDD